MSLELKGSPPESSRGKLDGRSRRAASDVDDARVSCRRELRREHAGEDGVLRRLGDGGTERNVERHEVAGGVDLEVLVDAEAEHAIAGDVTISFCELVCNWPLRV